MHATRPARDQRLEPYLQNQLMWRTLMTLAGGMRYAADESNPRPVPRLTLHDVKQRLAGGAPSGGGQVPDALYFAFYAERYRVPPEKAVTLPPEQLWWMADSHDTVLLSDRATHHYTGIARIDRAAERVYFDDPWPERFFLLEGRNTLGIAARTEQGLSVSKAEFLQAAVGLITWDTSRLVQHYFAAFPQRRAVPDTLIRFGFALMDAEADLFAPMASDLFAEAWRLEMEAGGGAEAELAARQAWLAASCGAWHAAVNGNMPAVAAMQNRRALVAARHGQATLEAGLAPAELARLANAAGNARDFPAARAALDRAVAKDRDFEDGYWLRATVALQQGELAGAAADAERAIALNDAALARLAAERARIDARARAELEWKDAQIGGRRSRRASELAVLLNARTGLGQFAPARAAAQAIIALKPGEPLGHLKLAVVERAAGRRDAAAAAMRAAIALEKDASQRAAYEQLAAELTRDRKVASRRR